MALCENCNKNEGSDEIHLCPYVEVVCLSEKECNCCDDCHYGCLQDI